jgi:catechol 2,3-dioxygenase-like lactoylglutathione lyase family enzyme
VSGDNALIPELAVTNCAASLSFYCDLLGFAVVYERPEEGFAFLAKGDAQLMIDEIGKGRTFEPAPFIAPLGRGVNFQILVTDLTAILERLQDAGVDLFLPLEEKWYRRNDHEVGNRQFIVADPDGYLLRLFEDCGERPLAS